MSKVIEVEIYKYGELSEQSQQKAREWYIEGMDYEWWEGVYEMAIKDGYEKGFCIDKIYFSGFHSQGDGASWTGQVDVRQWLEENLSDSIGVSAWCHLVQEDVISKHLKVVANNSHYCHESTMQVGEVMDDSETFDDDYTLKLPSIFKGMDIRTVFDLIESDSNCAIKTTEGIEQAILESVRDYAKDIYQRLKEEYEYLCSEEMMLDHFDANDYHFTNEGAITCTQQ
jgi:hypothetical protein